MFVRNGKDQKKLECQFSATSSTATFFMKVVHFLDILYLYILVCEVILMKGNFSSCARASSQKEEMHNIPFFSLG